jgi:hypothetical protein
MNMYRLPDNVLSFAAGDTSLKELIVSYVDYWNQYKSEKTGKHYDFSKNVSFAEKEDLLNAGMKREIGKMAGVDFSAMALEQAITHPMVAWSVMTLASQMIDAILPDTIIESTSAYADVRTLGFGETAVFDIDKLNCRL